MAEKSGFLNEKSFALELGLLLRKVRRQKKMTLEDLANESGLDYSTVNLIENGKQQPKAYTLYRLLSALDIDIKYFFDDKIARSATAVCGDCLANMTEKDAATLTEFLARFRLEKK